MSALPLRGPLATLNLDITGAGVLAAKALASALRELPKDAGLFIRVHAGPTVGFAAAAMQAGRDAGFDKVTYVPAGSSG